MRLWLAQCLCPKRHSLMATVSKDPKEGREESMSYLRQAVRKGLAGGDAAEGIPPMNRWCGICGATNDTWAFEVGLSRDFPTPEDALAEVLRLQAAQRSSREMLDIMGLTYDAQRRKLN